MPEPPPDPATVRLARPDDLPALKTRDPWPADAVWLRKIAAAEVVVLEVAGRPAGLARYAVLWTTVPFLGLIRIDPDHRGRGHSRRLLGFLCEHLRSQGYVALLSSSQTDEPAPQAWHAHMGFRSNGIIEHIADDNVGEVVWRLEL